MADGILWCSALFLQGASLFTVKNLEAAQNVALKVRLGLPKGALGPGTVVEAG